MMTSFCFKHNKVGYFYLIIISLSEEYFRVLLHANNLFSIYRFRGNPVNESVSWHLHKSQFSESKNVVMTKSTTVWPKYQSLLQELHSDISLKW